MECVRSETVLARKAHRCGLCGCTIPKGELHNRQANRSDGRMYTFRAHLHCQDLCGKIWDYVDPYDGMTEDEFCDAVDGLMHTFYCPFHCDEYDEEVSDCEREFDADVCVRRFAKFMETRRMDLVYEDGRGLCWKMVDLGKEAVDGRS